MIYWIKAGLASCLLIVMLLAAGCREKGAELQSSATPPDKELFKNGKEWLDKSQFLKARLAFQTLINTYPDSDLTPISFFSIADSYYNEGGKEAFLQAEAQYKDFMVFYPKHEKIAEAQLKIAALNMRMMEAPDRDPTYARRAETELKNFLTKFSTHPLVPEVKEDLKKVQDVLAGGEYAKGQFYYKHKNYKAAVSRYGELVKAYPQYGFMDTVLYELADSLIKLDRPNEAEVYLAQLIQGYDGSKAESAKKVLAELGKPIPPTDTVLMALHQQNRPPKEPLIRGPMAYMREAKKLLSTGPDPYEEALKRSEIRLGGQTPPTAVAAATEPPPNEKAQIQGVIVVPKEGTTPSATPPNTTTAPPPNPGNPPSPSNSVNGTGPGVQSGGNGGATDGAVKATPVTAPDTDKKDDKKADSKDPKKKRGLIKKIFRTGG